MKISRYILAAATLAGVLCSCQKETCPTPFCTMEFNLSADSLFKNAEFPIRNVAVFLRNEATKETYGPIDLNLSGAEITKNSTGTDVTYRCKVTQGLPYGDYTMWLWANVERKETYSHDRFSLLLDNNYVGADYMLGKACSVSLSERHSSIDIRMEHLMAAVAVECDKSIESGVSLYVSNVYGKVDAAGVYSAPGTTLEFEFDKNTFPVIPPKLFYTFPTSTSPENQSEMTLSFIRVGSTEINSESVQRLMKTGDYLNIGF